MNTPSEHWRPRIECSHALFKALENIELRRALQVVVKRWLSLQRARPQDASVTRRVA
jgi:hypothetical protein